VAKRLPVGESAAGPPEERWGRQETGDGTVTGRQHGRAGAPQSRVVAVVSGTGGTGATTTAIGIGSALATTRQDTAVVVDVHAGTSSIAAQAGAGRASRVVDIARDPWDAVAVRTPSGVYVVDGAPWNAPVLADEMEDALAVLTAHHTFTIVDIGNDLSVPAQVALSAADRAVLVVNPSPVALDGLREAVERIAEEMPVVAAETVVAMVCRRGQFRWVSRRLRQLGTDGAHVVAVPFDRSLAWSGRLEPARLGAATRRAYARLAALLSDAREGPGRTLTGAGGG
jgi:MinD-like ATPase involved in chromosome partitioning or flagellar assembly